MKKLHLTKSLIIIICICLCVVAAGVVFIIKKSPLAATISDDAVYSDSLFFSAPSGYIHLSSDEKPEFEFLDYKTLKNGSFWNGLSSAAFDKNMPAKVLAVYKNSVYTIASDGKTSGIYKSSMDGKSKEQLETMKACTGGRIIIMSGKLYYEKTEPAKESGDTTVSICALNFSDKKDSRVSPAHTGSNASITLAGYYKNCIYYLYSSSAYSKKGTSHAIYEYNLKTGKETAILSSIGKQTVLKFYKGNVYYILTNAVTNINTLYSYNLGTKRTIRIVSDKDLINGFQCFDNKVFYRKGTTDGKVVPENTQREGFCYDIKSKDISSVPIMNSKKDRLYIINESADSFILSRQSVDNNGQIKDVSLAYIKKSDYLAGKTNTTDFD